MFYHYHLQNELMVIVLFNPFSTNVPLLYYLETPDVFKGYRGGTLVENGLTLQNQPWKLRKYSYVGGASYKHFHLCSP